MNAREVVRRLRAFHQGRPLPRGATIHHFIADPEDLLIVAFVKMGGESRPWGVAWGQPGNEPRCRTVPEARDRNLTAAMMADFAPDLLEHLCCPGFANPVPSGEDSLAPLRQVWLPNGTHLDMLHQLAYAYTFTRWGDEIRGLLNALGRACGWLHREAERPGQQHVIVGTQALRSAFTFPAEDSRQGHLGFLLAWLTPEGGRDQRLGASLAAERQPVATSLDPEIERSVLEPQVEGWREARDANNWAAMSKAEEEIDGILREALTARFRLTEHAITLLRADPRRENVGVQGLVAHAARAQWREHTRMELRIAGYEQGRVYVPSVETDRYPAAAAAGYHQRQAARERLESALIHDDPDLLAEAIAAGEAFAGVVERVVDEGAGRATVPVWMVRARRVGQVKLRADSRLCVVGLPNREARVREITDDGAGGLLFELEIIACKTTPRGAEGKLRVRAGDDLWEGEEVAFCKASAEGISIRKAIKAWDRDVPGAWLTHLRPGGVLARIDSEDNDSASVGATT